MTEIESFLRQTLDQVKKWGGGSQVWRQAGGPEGAEAGGMEGRGPEDTFCQVHNLADGTGQEVSKH